MKVFIWDYIRELTDNYHPDGGLVVIAENLENAIQLATLSGVVFNNELPVQELPVPEGTEAKVYVFPDAGCC